MTHKPYPQGQELLTHTMTERKREKGVERLRVKELGKERQKALACFGHSYKR